jgi:GNAT superfamily N-acetyltransferase
VDAAAIPSEPDPIRLAGPADLERVRELLHAYAQELAQERCFPDFELELADPFGVYARVLLAAQGCVALRRIDAATAEMKRLYVSAAARGGGLGRRLTEALIEQARRDGYAMLRLDTLPAMTAARALYATLGFEPTAPFGAPPTPGAHFLARAL